MFEGLFQPTHLLVIAFIAMFVFGPKKLPELGKGLGEGIKGFKDAMRFDGHEAPNQAEAVKAAEVEQAQA
jgi:sec-independent protein translocase protein TatA